MLYLTWEANLFGPRFYGTLILGYLDCIMVINLEDILHVWLWSTKVNHWKVDFLLTNSFMDFFFLDLLAMDSRHKHFGIQGFISKEVQFFKILKFEGKVSFLRNNLHLSFKGQFPLQTFKVALQKSQNQILHKKIIHIWPRVDFFVKQLTKVKLTLSYFFFILKDFHFVLPISSSAFQISSWCHAM